MKKLLMAMTALALFAMMAVPASAAKDWQLSYPASGWVNLFITGGIQWSGFYTGDVTAGAFAMQATEYNAAHDTVIGGYNAYTYCMDGVYVANPDWYERGVGGLPPTNSPALTSANWGRMVWLNQNYGLDSLQNTTKSAGFQLAIWEILNDTGTSYDLNAGIFRASFDAAVMTQANAYLGYLGANTASSIELAKQTYFWDGQNMLETPSVPEPVSMALGLMGLSTLAGYARLRRRKA